MPLLVIDDAVAVTAAADVVLDAVFAVVADAVVAAFIYVAVVPVVIDVDVASVADVVYVIVAAAIAVAVHGFCPRITPRVQLVPALFPGEVRHGCSGGGGRPTCAGSLSRQSAKYAVAVPESRRFSRRA